MMRWDSWNGLSKIPWDLSNKGSGIKSFCKSFVIDEAEKDTGQTHVHKLPHFNTNTHTNTYLPSLKFRLLQH